MASDAFWYGVGESDVLDYDQFMRLVEEMEEQYEHEDYNEALAIWQGVVGRHHGMT